MLVLTRRPGESIVIGDDIVITIVEVKGGQVRVGIDAPRQIRVYREEVYNEVRQQNLDAARSADDAKARLRGGQTAE